MPFAVSQWPYSPDPRSPKFSATGYDFGQVPPIKWILSSTEAVFPYSFLNAGLLVSILSDTGAVTVFQSVAAPFPVTLVKLSKAGLPAPGGGPVHTIAWKIRIHTPSLGRLAGTNDYYTWPKAIRVFGPWDVSDEMGPVGEIPNGITITPAIWSA